MAMTVLALSVATASGAAAAKHRRHHYRLTNASAEAMPLAAAPPLAQDRAAYRSGFAFGLFDLGISGTPTAVSPYAGAGYVSRRYDGPGFGYPGY